MRKKVLVLACVVLCVILALVSCAGNMSQTSTESGVVETASDKTEETVNQTTTDTEETDVQESITTQATTEKPVVTNIVTGEPVEIKVYEITITYVFSDGTKAAPSRKAQYEAGTHLYVESPEIEGYEPNLKYVEWSSISREKVFRVVYSPVEGETTEETE